MRIEDLALIGDCETAALVHHDGSVCWLCWPRFDSEACFAALLGSEENGYWRIAAVDQNATVSRRYAGESLILETLIETSAGAATVLDFMPVRGEASDIIRIVRGRSGTVNLRSDLRLRPGYGRTRPSWTMRSTRHALAESTSHRMRLVADVPLGIVREGDCEAEFSVSEGQQYAFILTYFSANEREPAAVDAALALQETRSFWHDWVQQCTYEGPWREAVVRSLIALKGLTYRPTGGILAAPTSSLPEVPGGARNWDYRYCWLRDATFTLLCFLHCGYMEEAVAWRDWLLHAAGTGEAGIQPVYGIAGERQLPEFHAPWLSGFGGAQPVRFGNAACKQLQWDVYGEVIDALWQGHERGIPLSPAAWKMQVNMSRRLKDAPRIADQGIWESRDTPRHFTYSQAMVWAAWDRMIRRAQAQHLEAPVEQWKNLRDEIHAQICREGFNTKKGSFVRDYGSDEVDASLLLLPQIGFIDARDERFLGTVAAIERDLLDHGFLYRCSARGNPDCAGFEEGAFLVCNFWYVDALLMTGRRCEAHELFEQLLSVRNDLGLLAEQYDPRRRELRGNFPQALSHLALVNSALNLQRNDGPVRSPGIGREAAGGGRVGARQV